MTRRLALGGLLALMAALALLPAAALGAQPRASFTDVEDEVMCDTCNVPLYIAESPRADQLRDEIRRLIAAGKTKAEIKAQLKSEYGPDVLALPEDKGFSLAAYLVPIIVAAGLLATLLALVPRWRRRGRDPDGPDGGPEDAGPELSGADERRLDDELARFGV